MYVYSESACVQIYQTVPISFRYYLKCERQFLTSLYSDDSLNRSRFSLANIAGLTSSPDYWIAH